MNAEALTVNQAEAKSEKISNCYLFFTFMKIGCVSFGGHMALLSVVQKILVERDRKAEAGVFTNAISIASLLPGPMAVNAVTYVGFKLNRKRGALFSLLGILFPASLIMMLLSWLYFNQAFNIQLQKYMLYITGAVASIVVSVGILMYKKEVQQSVVKNLICCLSFLLLCLSSNYFITGFLILAGLLFGGAEFITLSPPSKLPILETKRLTGPGLFIKIALMLLVLIQVAFFADVQSMFDNIYLKIAVVFSGMSLTLFGGGYVMIPIMQSLFVHELQWLSSQEFIDAIALSQVTPGPILVSATFIGYKIGGFTGALLATVCIFAPSALLITVVSQLLRKFRHQQLLQSALNGAKVVIVGMIFASAFKLIQAVQFNVTTILICFISLVVVVRWKMNPVTVITASIFVGLIIENLL
jgi:chromate transporter